MFKKIVRFKTEAAFKQVYRRILRKAKPRKPNLTKKSKALKELKCKRDDKYRKLLKKCSTYQ